MLPDLSLTLFPPGCFSLGLSYWFIFNFWTLCPSSCCCCCRRRSAYSVSGIAGGARWGLCPLSRDRAEHRLPPRGWLRRIHDRDRLLPASLARKAAQDARAAGGREPRGAAAGVHVIIIRKGRWGWWRQRWGSCPGFRRNPGRAVLRESADQVCQQDLSVQGLCALHSSGRS